MPSDATATALPSSSEQTALDRLTGPLMFWLTVLWLALLGIGLHLLQDGVLRPAAIDDTLEAHQHRGRFDTAGLRCLAIAFWLAPVYLAEAIAHLIVGPRRSWVSLPLSLIPPLRIVGRDHTRGQTVWLPGWGWVPTAPELEAGLERQLSFPMIGVALLVLPVIAVEFLWADRIERDVRLGLVAQLAAAFIWLAFAVEFLVLTSITSSRVRYLRHHWLDLVIICLPLVAFLRVLRIGRLGRLLRLHQLGTVTRSARAFRLKGLAFRVWRAVLLLDVIDRLVHRDDEQRLAKLMRRLAEKEQEVDALRQQIARVERRMAAAASAQSSEVAEVDRAGGAIAAPGGVPAEIATADPAADVT